jgi:hypothetical protein
MINSLQSSRQYTDSQRSPNALVVKIPGNGRQENHMTVTPVMYNF